MSQFITQTESSEKTLLTYSALNTFRNCPRKYKNRYLDNLRPRERAEALSFGSVIHTAIADISRGVILGGRFKLVDFLGDGSFGYVWKAEVIDYEAIKLPPVVAIKIFKQSESGDKFLFREAQTAEKFDHSRLVKIFDAKRIDGLPIMWMEYVPGESLHRLIGDSRSPMPASLNTVLDWLKGIAEGLAHMHMQQPPVGHGDLKLDNVIVDPDKGVRLVDFGQSKQLPEKFVDTDGNGAFPYLAPELMDKSEGGEGKRCAASDIYAAGVIAYRILTGRLRPVVAIHSSSRSWCK